MISANGGLPAHRYKPQVTPRWPRGSEPASNHTKFFLSILCLATATMHFRAHHAPTHTHKNTILGLKFVKYNIIVKITKIPC